MKPDLAVPAGPRPAIVLDENQIVMPPGKYRLGDPCYSVPNDRWSEWLDATGSSLNDEDNIYALLDGWPIIGFSTAYGDGSYEGSDGHSYPVDAGLIGLVPVEIADDRYSADQGLWTVVEFTKPTLCSNTSRTPGRGWTGRTEGLMKFGDITIDTRDEEVD